MAAKKVPVVVHTRPFADAIAQHLAYNLMPGSTWTVKPPSSDESDRRSWEFKTGEHRDDVVGPEGMVVTVVRENERLKFWGSYPPAWNGDDYPYNRDRPESISVSGARTPDQVAADFGRRWWPLYRDAFVKGQGIVAEINARRMKQMENIVRVANIFAVKADLSGKKENNVISTYNTPIYKLKSCHGDVEVSDDAVSINIRCVPADIAFEMLELLMARAKERAEKSE